MKVQEINSRLTEVLQGTFGHPERSEGLHVSRIWEDLDRAIHAKRGGIDQYDLEEYGTLGFVWERVLETTLEQLALSSGRYMRPGEQFCDGIYLTPDYVDLDFVGDGSWIMGVEEWKVRWCSYRKGDNLEQNFWKWLVQTKAYCYVLNTNLARLRSLFIAGDWKQDITPRLRTWELIFTSRELQNNWDMLTGHAKRKGWL